MHTTHILSAILFLLIVSSAYAVYSPPGFALDMWFIKEKGVWHQFELNGPHPSDWDKQWPPLNQPDRPPLAWFEQGIFHSTSKDLITWKDEGVAVTIGKVGEWDDGKIASGNIVKHQGTYYLFYPGIREHPRPGECATPIGVATSKDMVHWTKHPGNPVMVPDGKIYDPAGNWRDCNFLWDEKAKVWYTVVCATATQAMWEASPDGDPTTASPSGDASHTPVPIESRGCIALLKSADLIHWEALPPLVISDRYTLGMELPFLFRHGKKWYLGHSMYSSYFAKEWLAKHPEVEARGGVHYFIGDSMFGPFTTPEDDCLGCQPDPPPYAMQLIDEGGEKLFMHWGPVRYATALPKKIEFLPNDLMRLVYWKGTEKARKESLLVGGDSNRRFTLDAETPSVDIGTPVIDCFFEGTVSGSGTAGFAFGSAFLVSLDASTGIVRSLNPADRTPRLGREGKVSPNGPIRIRLVADGSVIDVYANDIWMFSEHCGRPDPDQAHLVALSGKVTVDKVCLDRLATGNPIHHYGFNY